MLNFKSLSILALPFFVFSCNSSDFSSNKIETSPKASSTPKPISTKLPTVKESYSIPNPVKNGLV